MTIRERLQRIIWTLAVLAALLLMMYQDPAYSQDDEDDEPEVTYCINLQTGETQAVQAGMPCPYPMAEM